jgi:hypothetical protein
MGGPEWESVAEENTLLYHDVEVWGSAAKSASARLIASNAGLW